jgi:hypothetical protein
LRRYKINTQVIKCVKVKQGIRNNEGLTGYYILYPISKECEKLISEGLLVQGRQIEPHHICEDFEQASALYLSLIYGKDKLTRAFLLYLIRRDVTEILNKNENISRVYTRPCTPDGFRIVEKNGLSKLPANPQIYFYRRGNV